jgi:multidrug resistance efflux pump
VNPGISVKPARARRCRAKIVRCCEAILVAVLVASLHGAACFAQAQAPAGKPPAGKAALPQGPTRELVERGAVASARSVILRCEAPSPDNSGITILELVPEGTLVRPGDVLVKLDSSLLEEDRNERKIVAAGCAAMVQRAKDDVETAKLARQEYAEGTSVVQSQAIQNELFAAEGQLRRAEEELKAIGQGATEKAVPLRVMEDARFAVQKARNEVDLAKARLQVLEKLTKAKMLRQLNGDVAAAEAKLKAEEANLQLVQDRVAQVEGYIAKCTIKAPAAGTVIYENPSSAGGRRDAAIEEGARVRERQPILRLDDLSQLQVRARVHESRISLIKPDMKARIRADALPDVEMVGTVVSVSAYPEPASWLAPGLKEYAAVIRIEKPPSGLRVGLTAEVRIPVQGLAAAAGGALQGTSRELRSDYLFDTMDRNGDGRLDRQEVPDALWSLMKKFDSNGDGAIDRAEWRTMQQQLPPRGPAR